MKTSVLLLAIVLGLVMPRPVQASHIGAVDLHLDLVDSATDTWRVTILLYRDCSGIFAPTSMPVLYSNSCLEPGPPTLSATALPDSAKVAGVTYHPGDEVSFACPVAGATYCGGGTLPGVTIHPYTVDITLPAGSCDEWTFSTSICCRNNTINNLSVSSVYETYVEAVIRTQAGSSSSPRFSRPAIGYFSVSQPGAYAPGAVDPDGDSMAFSLVAPLSASGSSVPHAPGYTATQPISSTGGVSLDAADGQLLFTPAAPEIDQVGLLLDSYRDGVWVGSVRRDMQFTMYMGIGGNASPQYAGTFTSVGDGTAVGPRRVETEVGKALTFTMDFTDGPGFDLLSLESDLQEVFPGASLFVSGLTALTATVEWSPGPGDEGSRFFTLEVNDGACPIENRQSWAFTVDVKPASGACDAPTLLNSAPSPATTLLFWNSIPGALGYRLRGVPLGGTSPKYLASASALKTVSGLPPGGYVWQVRTACASDTSAWSLPDTFFVPALFTDPSGPYASAREQFGPDIEATDHVLVVSPNPNAGRFALDLSAFEAPLTLRIYDAAGRLLLERHSEADAGSTELLLPEARAGLHVLQVEDARGVSAASFLVE